VTDEGRGRGHEEGTWMAAGVERTLKRENGGGWDQGGVYERETTPESGIGKRAIGATLEGKIEGERIGGLGRTNRMAREEKTVERTDGDNICCCHSMHGR
jgi:hypothetical protein